MAFLIPENLRTDKSVPAAHRRIAGAFAFGLDERVIVWYEPPIDPSGRRPHFVVVDPTMGVVVVQAIDQVEDTPKEVLGTWAKAVRVLRGGQEREIENPLAEAQQFAAGLEAQLATMPALAHVPVAAAAALPFLTRDEAEERGLASVIDLDASLTKDAISAATGDDTILPKTFARLLGGILDDDLDDQTIDLLRAVVHPDTVIGARPAVPATPVADGALFDVAAVEDPASLRVMDRQQERMARALGSGHRVIRGVAGSGKTLVLVHRARALATMLPSKKILVTCYTKALASQLEAELSDLPNVEVKNLSRLMLKTVTDAGLRGSGKIDWDGLPGLALEAVQRRRPERYRAVMVDEAQDFDTDALRFCVELLDADESSEGDLVIVADSAQNIFRRNFRWKDAGINAQGRTKILRVNYRNTRPILEFAYRFLTAGVAAPTDVDLDDETAIIPAESAERDGPAPSVIAVGNVDAEIDAVVAQVRDWYDPQLRPRSIAVLLTTTDGAKRGQRIVAGLRAAGIPTFWTHEDDWSKDRIGQADEPVVVTTIHSAKGLEFSRVVVAGLAHGLRDEPRKLLYVGFTRAIDELTVVVDRSSPFTRDLV
jgi:hypothetical protein